jgi:hypothetical protein
MTTGGWNLKYRNCNPNPDTICSECRIWIGEIFAPGNAPPLPMHKSCFCYLKPVKADPTWPPEGKTWADWFDYLRRVHSERYRRWIQRAAWFLRRLWPLGVMEPLRDAAEQYNEEREKEEAQPMPSDVTSPQKTPQKSSLAENRGNHPLNPQNAAGNGPQRAALGHVMLQIGGEEEEGYLEQQRETSPRYDAILVKPGWIRNADGTDSDWLIPADVLQDAADRQLFSGISHYVDHPELFGFGWHQSPSVKDLGGVVSEGRWDPELQGVRGTIRLYDTEAGQLMRTLYDQILADKEAGLDVPRIGLSIAAFRKYRYDKESGKKVWTHIKKVDSVDLVYEPGAAGYIRQALSAMVTGTWRSRRSVPVTSPAQPNPQTSGSPGANASNHPTGGHIMEEEARTQQVAQVEPSPEPEPETSQLGRPSLPAQEPTAQQPASGPPSPQPQSELERIKANVDKIQEIVGRLSTVVLQQEEHQTIEGMGEAPRAPGYLYGGRTGVDQLEVAVEHMIAGTRPPSGVRPLTGIRELYMLLSGDYELTGRWNPDRVYLANVTTSTMANIVADALNKRVVNMFQTYDKWWAPAVTIQDFASLQDVKWITLGGVGELPTVAEGAAYTEMTWDDQKEEVSFIKKGGYLGITLETIDKDDTSRVMAAPRALAQAAWMTLGKAIAEIFTANSGTGPTMDTDSTVLFHADHSNLGSTALSYASWKATKILMMKFTELNSGERLGALTRPRLLWVPIDLEDTAVEILAAGEGEIGSADYHVNPDTLAESHRARVRAARSRVITVPFWTDTDNWAAQADPNLYPSIGLGFRYGRTPEIFSVADPRAGLMFTNDTMPIKVRFFFAVGPTDYRGLYKHNVT